MWFGTLGQPLGAKAAAAASTACCCRRCSRPQATRTIVARLHDECERIDRDPATLRICQSVITAPELDDSETRALAHARAVTYLDAPGYGEMLVQLNGWDPAPLAALRDHEQFKGMETAVSDLSFHRTELLGPASLVPDEWMEESCALGLRRRVRRDPAALPRRRRRRDRHLRQHARARTPGWPTRGAGTPSRMTPAGCRPWRYLMAIDLTGKVAIVTGATRGIGRALTLAFAANGADVVGSARNPGPAAELAEEVRLLGRTFTFVEADVSDLGDCERVVAAAVAAHGRIDVLINNAGTSLPQVSIEHITEEDWRAVAGPTLDGTLFMSRAVLPTMLEQSSGVIINVASAAGVAGMATMGAYGLSKAAAIHLAKVIAVENLGRGVRANALIVGAVATDLAWGSLVAHARAVHGPDFEPAPPTENGDSAMDALMIEPEALADAVMLLCSDDAREINGATIAIDRTFSAGAPASTLVSMAAAGMAPA